MSASAISSRPPRSASRTAALRQVEVRRTRGKRAPGRSRGPRRQRSPRRGRRSSALAGDERPSARVVRKRRRPACPARAPGRSCRRPTIGRDDEGGPGNERGRLAQRAPVERLQRRVDDARRRAEPDAMAKPVAACTTTRSATAASRRRRGDRPAAQAERRRIARPASHAPSSG